MSVEARAYSTTARSAVTTPKPQDAMIRGDATDLVSGRSLPNAYANPYANPIAHRRSR